MDKKILKSKQNLLNSLGIKENYLYNNFSKRYYLKKLKKKGGTFREIKPPDKKLKDIQKKILSEVFMNLKLVPSVHGLRVDKGILQNAYKHQCNASRHLVNLDIKDFFPSVNLKSVRKVFTRIGFNTECAKVLTKLCTIDNSLPQGAPTSPYISALALEDLDKNIYKYCVKNNLIYSRYFDDICFSGDLITEKHVGHIEILIFKRGYQLNLSKKQWFKPEEEKIINSVVLHKKYFDVTEKYKDKISKSYLIYKKTGDEKDWRIFIGNTPFYLYVNRVKALSFFKKVTGVEFRNRNMLLITS